MRINPNFQFSLFNFSDDFFLQVFFLEVSGNIVYKVCSGLGICDYVICFRPQDAGFTSDLKGLM